MNNPFTLEFKLRQHTPMIHFQHEQDGATLRATEVKPKLDNFIMKRLMPENLIQNDFMEHIGLNQEFIDVPKLFKRACELSKYANWQEWLVGKGKAEHVALDYKLSIQASAIENQASGKIEKIYKNHGGYDREDPFPTFFGNMGEENNGRKEFTFYNDINVKIVSSKPGLINEIENAISDFFMNHNFGNRQSKGFGSFFPEDIRRFKLIPLEYSFEVDVQKPSMKRLQFVGESPTQRFRQYQRLFEIINLFYSTLRSGINQGWGTNPIYFKSLMFMYAKNKMNAQWDKKSIKEFFFNGILQNHKDKYGGSDTLNFSTQKKYLMRDLLGLASTSEWYAEYRDTITVASKGEKIERFKSPILFKPIETSSGKFKVHFTCNQKNIDSIGNKNFEITTIKVEAKKLQLATPPEGEFVFKEFMQYALSLDLENHIVYKSVGNTSQDADLIKNIYNQIRNSAR